MPAPAHRPPPVVVVGASAGGLEPLRQLVASMPADLPAALFVVVHVPATAPSALGHLLDRAGPLPAAAAADLAPIRPATVTVARPDHHLLLKQDHVRLVRGPRENGHRPAIDPLFRSAAAAHGRAVTAVVLSGTLDDGTIGAAHVHDAGGRVFVQDPHEATYSEMPDNVRVAIAVDGVLPVRDIAAAIVEWAGSPPPGGDGADVTDPTESAERAIAPLDTDPGANLMGCPNCGGPMAEERHRPGLPSHYRCRVGHAWTLDSLLHEQHGDLERSLWTAVRVLEERVALLDRLAERAGQRDHLRARQRYVDEARQATAEARRLRELLVHGPDERERRAPAEAVPG